jgi:hypothetical protein
MQINGPNHTNTNSFSPIGKIKNYSNEVNKMLAKEAFYKKNLDVNHNKFDNDMDNQKSSSPSVHMKARNSYYMRMERLKKSEKIKAYINLPTRSKSGIHSKPQNPPAYNQTPSNLGSGIKLSPIKRVIPLGSDINQDWNYQRISIEKNHQSRMKNYDEYFEKEKRSKSSLGWKRPKLQSIERREDNSLRKYYKQATRNKGYNVESPLPVKHKSNKKHK